MIKVCAQKKEEVHSRLACPVLGILLIGQDWREHISTVNVQGGPSVCRLAYVDSQYEVVFSSKLIHLLRPVTGL